MSEEQAMENQEQTKEAPAESLPRILKDLEGAPSQDQIDKWKTEFGEVFVSGFAEDDMYVWRSISRAEWIKLQELANDPKNPLLPHQLEEMICDTCILWRSKKIDWSRGKAGTVVSLHEQILQNSNFLTPQAASFLVAKL